MRKKTYIPVQEITQDSRGINTENENGKIPEAYATAIGHESFMHMDQYSDRMISAYDRGENKVLNGIRYERSQIANDRRGRPEHVGYLNRKPTFNTTYTYLSQLKSILNPIEVNRQIKRHDEKLRKDSMY